MTQGKMIDRLKRVLSKRRFVHTLGVAETAQILAKTYDVDAKRAYTAGLLHDCAKDMGAATLRERCARYEIELDEISFREHSLLHAYVGAHIAREEYNVREQEIFDAIYYHTIGRPNMTRMDKILYIADTIEPNRTLAGVNEIRAAAAVDLDRALVLSLESTIKFVISRNRMLHENTIKARNYIILNSGGKANGN